MKISTMGVCKLYDQICLLQLGTIYDAEQYTTESIKHWGHKITCEGSE